MCNKSDSFLCNRCKSARYCSKSCQQADWPTHKLLCANFSTFDPSSRPSNDHIQAILFPVEDKKPKIVWLHCKWNDDDEDERYQFAEFEPFFGPDTLTGRLLIQYNPVLKRKLSDTICITHRETFLVDGSKANRSIASITALEPERWHHDWRGTIIAYGMIGLDYNETTYRDLSMNDFRHITDFFLSHNSDPSPVTQQPVGTKVEGVRINCLGDQKMLNRPHFEAVEVYSTDPIFSKHDTSDIANRIGLPVFT